MSALFNQTNISPGQSLYITRTEVIQGFSTLAGDLSGVNLSTIFTNPNPIVSTLTVNPSGLIGGYPIANLSKVNLSTTQALGLTNIYNYPGAITALATASSSNTAPVVGIGFKAQLLTNTNAQQRIDYNFNQITATQDGANYNPLAVYTPALNPVWSLSNVSTINGLPVSGGTTFTNLTGSNLTVTGTLLSPQVTGISSINGVGFQTAYNNVWSGSFPTTFGSNAVTTIASITLPNNYLQPNTNYIYDVPLIFTSIPPSSPQGFILNLGIRLGNNGQINYSYPLLVLPSSQGLPLTLSGIAQTNAVTVGSQQIQIVGVQGGATSLSTQFNAPSSGGGLNTYTIKPLN